MPDNVFLDSVFQADARFDVLGVLSDKIWTTKI